MKQEVTSEVWTAVSSLFQLSLDSIVLINRQSAAEIHTELHLEAEDGSKHSGPHTPGSSVKSFPLTSRPGSLPLAGLDSLSSEPVVLNILVEVEAHGRS